MAVEGSKRSDGALKQLGILVLRMNVLMMVMVYMMQPGQVTAEGTEEEAAMKESNLAMIEMNVRNLYPEGFDWDARHKRFLVGSMGKPKLYAVKEDGTVEDFVEDEDYAGAIILGVTVDHIQNRVLAVVHKPTSPNRINALAAYDLDTKKRTLFVNLFQEDEDEDDSVRSTKNVVANDVAVDWDGNAYVTNSGGNLIWKVTLTGVRSVFVASVPQLPIVVEDEFVKTVTCNGIIVHQDGYLLVSQSNSGGLLRVRLVDKNVQAVNITDGTHGALMPQADGIALRSRESLIVVSTHTAWLLSSTDSWISATLVDKIPLDTGGSTTAVTVKDWRVFTIHAHLTEYFKGMDRDSFKILEIDFPADDSQSDSPLWLLAILGIFVVLVFVWKCQMNQFNEAYTKKRA